MVKVVDKSLEERTFEDTLKKLTEIAKTMFDAKAEVFSAGDGISISYTGMEGSNHITVNPTFCSVRVCDKRYYGDAFRFAEAYEELVKKEVTLKKDY